MTQDVAVETFEQIRPTLMGIAYRILGSTADAADAVQDTYLAWREVDHGAIRSARAWLITACSRRALDLAAAANRARVDYVGTWLPDLVHTTTEDGPATSVARASSVTAAFLLLLERLTPRERAAYVLREIFDCDYSEIATALEMQEPACRQLVARARSHVGEPAVRHRTPRARQDALIDAFRLAVATDSAGALAGLLADDVELTVDGGPKTSALRETLHGRDAVAGFIASTLATYWRPYALRDTELNATRGLEVVDGDHLAAAAVFEYDAHGRVTHVFIMRNPDKLAPLHARTAVLD